LLFGATFSCARLEVPVRFTSIVFAVGASMSRSKLIVRMRTFE
jgi:hypothetical protein